MERQKQPGQIGSSANDSSEAPEAQGTGMTGQEHPYGTLFLLLVYLIVVVAIWGTVYLTMLERG